MKSKWIVPVIILACAAVFSPITAYSAPKDEDQQPAGEVPVLPPIPAIPMMLPPSPPVLQQTSDGHILVLAGNKLMKFDSDLKLVKKTTLLESPDQA